MAKKEKKQLFTLAEAAEIIGIDKRTIVAHNLLPVIRLGSWYYIRRTDIADLVGSKAKF